VDLANHFSRGKNEYPTTLVGSYQLLLNYKAPPNPLYRDRFRRGPGHGADGWPTAVVARGHGGGRGVAGGRNPWWHGGCGQPGQVLTQLACTPPTGLILTLVSLSLSQVADHFPQGIPNHYVLLNSDSTVSIFCNPDLLTNIHDVDFPLYLESNGGGYQITQQVGTSPISEKYGSIPIHLQTSCPSRMSVGSAA
jgi:hypothetical protein